MRTLLLFAFSLAVAAAAPSQSERIAGGSLTTITQYPFAASVLYSTTGSAYFQSCGASIINNRAVLTTASCLFYIERYWLMVRVGSSYAASGGVTRIVNIAIRHPQFNSFTYDNDVAILRVSSNFVFNNNVRAGSIAGPNFNIPDNLAVWTIGWGQTYVGGARSNQLRHVQIWTVNQAVCRSLHAELGRVITDSMLCAGYLNVGGRDHCYGDEGGAVISNNAIIGISSWRQGCGHPRYPGVSTRVPRFTAWIQANA